MWWKLLENAMKCIKKCDENNNNEIYRYGAVIIYRYGAEFVFTIGWSGYELVWFFFWRIYINFLYDIQEMKIGDEMMMKMVYTFWYIFTQNRKSVQWRW